MLKNNKKIKILIFISIFQFQLYSPPVSYQAIGTFAGAAKQTLKKPISNLAAGKAYLDIMKDMYSYGVSTSPTTQLLRNQRVGLFNVNGNAFRTSQNKANPTYILGGQLAGKVIGGLTTQEIFTKAGSQALTEFWRKQFKEQFPQDKLSHQRVNEFVDLLKRSYEETHSPSSLYIPELTEIALFSHQAIREQPIDELLSMYKELSDAGIVDFTSISPQRLYTKAAFNQFKEIIDKVAPQEKVQRLLKLPELAIATQFHILENAVKFPPAPKQANFCYKGQGSVPNCVETGLHDLVNLLVFDPETRTFNPQKMLPVNTNPQLIDFYQKYNNADGETINNSRQDWFNLMSEIPGTAYNSGNHELLAFFENQVHVLNFLFGTSAKTLEEFNNLFSKPERKIFFEPQRTNKSHNKSYGSYNLMIDTITGFELIADPAHGYFKRPAKLNGEITLFNKDSTKKILESENAAHFLPFLAHDLTLEDPARYILMKFYSSKLDDPNNLSEAIHYLRAALLRGLFKDNAQENEAINIIYESLQKLPLDDEHFQKFAIDIALVSISYLYSKGNPNYKKLLDFLERFKPDLVIKKYFSLLSVDREKLLLPFSTIKEYFDKSQLTEEDKDFFQDSLSSYKYMAGLFEAPGFENDYLTTLFGVDNSKPLKTITDPLQRTLIIDTIVNKIQSSPKNLIKPYLQYEYNRIRKWSYLKGATAQEMAKILQANKNRIEKIFQEEGLRPNFYTKIRDMYNFYNTNKPTMENAVYDDRSDD